jgi:transposase
MAYKVNLTHKQEERLKKIVRENKEHPNILKRAYCILLRNEGQKNENITKLLDIHEDTIADWTRLYLRKGLNGLLSFRYHRRRKSGLNPYRAKIRRLAAKRSVNTVEALQSEIKEKYSLDVEYSWLYRYCKKNNIYSYLNKKS